MEFEQIKQLCDTYVMNTYGRNQIALKGGKGSTLIDVNDKEYIDLTSGIGVNCLGHGHPALVNAICKQAETLCHCSNLFYTEPMGLVAQNLVKSTGMTNVFFGNSGAEANEGMMKLARKYSYDKYGENRNKILSLKQSFHGRTMATLTATGQDKFHQYFFPFPEGFDYVEANNFDDFKSHLDGTVCAVMMEIIQGEGGILCLDKEFVQQVTAYCQENDILVLIDEVQTGIGRTGRLFAYEHYDIKPDIVSMAKGLGGGVPIGAFMANEKCSTVLVPGTHGSTFGANPLSCAAANAVLSVVNQPDFLKTVEENGNYFMAKLKEIESDNIKDVRGLGLMIGIEVDEEKRAGFIKDLAQKGVLALTAGKNVIRILPPLIITKNEIDQALAAFKEVF